MSYREAFVFGWSIAWRQALWTAAIGIPFGLVVAVVVNQTTPNTSMRDFAFSIGFYPVFAAMMLLVISPKAIRGAVAKAFSGFRVQASKGGVVSELSYSDSVQVSLLGMIVSMVLGGLYSLIEFPTVTMGLLVEAPLVLLVVYPAIAEAAVYVRYRGFRLVVLRGEA